jgi:cytochrome c oxidase subunit 2
MSLLAAGPGQTTQQLFHEDFTTFSIIACAIFILITLTMVFALWRYRAARGHTPSVNRKLEKMEVSYLAVVAGIAGFLIFTSLTTNMSRISTKPYVRISVTGYQWCWRFLYEKTPLSITATCNPGDDPTFEVPQGKVVDFDVTSADVIHGFWIPETRFKIYAYPNHVNHFEDTFNQLGTFPGRCAVFCGLFHKDMDFYVKVVPLGQFQSWLHANERRGSVTT